MTCRKHLMPPDVVEDGATFEANARKKAVEVATAIGQWCLGEDSGLVALVLGGRPVVILRYAGTHGNDAANNQKLLAELAPFSATSATRTTFALPGSPPFCRGMFMPLSRRSCRAALSTTDAATAVSATTRTFSFPVSSNVRRTVGPRQECGYRGR